MSDKVIPFGMNYSRVSPFGNSASHKEFRKEIREWVEREVCPHIDDWEENGTIPRELHVKAAKERFYTVGIPKEFGGHDDGQFDMFHRMIICEELVRCGSLGFAAALLTWGIGLPPIFRWGSDYLKQKVVPAVANGSKLICLCITEPWGGSDVAAVRTSAKEEGDYFIVSGNKTFITTGCRADYFTVAVRTGSSGLGGVSLLLLEKGMPGITTTPMKKMGWLCSDTAIITFDNVKVPKKNLIGQKNKGFFYIMQNFNYERISMSANCVAASRVCIEEAIAYGRQRKTFGKPLVANQGIRWKIMEVIKEIEAAQALLDSCAWSLDESNKNKSHSDPLLIAKLSMLKLKSTRVLEYAAREACQVLGGKSFIRGGRAGKVERIYREVRVMAIGGGSEEIMLELASRQAKL